MPQGYHAELQKKVDALALLRGETLLAAIRGLIEFARENDDGDTAASFAKDLIEVASHEGRLDYEMIGFGELKAMYERDPRYADLRQDVLWYYKWLAENLPSHLEVSSDQIEGLFQDMEKFYRRENEGLRPVYVKRARAASFMGRAEEAGHWRELWDSLEKQESDDCQACETDARVQLYLELGKPIEALQAAEPIVTGEQECDEVPATTCSRLLLPITFLGNAHWAMFLGRAVQRQVRYVPKLLGYLADHVMFQSIVGDMTTAGRLGKVMLARAEHNTCAWDRFNAARAGWVWLTRLAASGKTTVSLPRTGIGNGEPLAVETAAGECRSRAQELADAFDRRNGTSRFAELMAEAQSLADLPWDESFDPQAGKQDDE